MTALGPTNAAEWMRQVNKDIADLKRHRHPDTTPVVDQVLLEETVQAAVALGLETEVADPITPSTPIVQSGPGYVSVAWDGFGAGGEMLPSGFDHVTVHRSTEGPDFEPVTGRTDGSTEAITMRVPGAVVFNDQPYGVAYWYRLVMVNTVQEESAPSEAVEGTAVAVVSQADLDAIDAAVAQAQADADTARDTADAVTALTSSWTAVDGLTIDGGKIYAESITTNAIATGAITAASGIIASIDAATITVGTIKAAQIGVGEITSVSGVVGDLSATHLKSGTLDANLVTVLNLDAGSITTGTLDAARIGAGSIDTIHLAAGAVDAASLAANVALIGKISSSEAGRRWEADPDGIRVYDDSGAVIVHFPTNLADSGNSIKGDLTATSLTIEDNLKIMGLINEVSKGGRLVLSSGTTSPSSAPTLTMDWETYGPATDATFDPYKRGLALYAGKYYYTQDVYAQNTNIQRMNAATGAREFYGHQLSTVTWAEGGCTVLGGILYVLGKKQAGGWAVEKWDLLNDVRIGYWNWTAPGLLSAEPAIGNDGTNILIGMTLTDSTVQWSTHTPSTGAQVGSTTVTNHATSRGVTAIMGGTFDFGASRVVMQFKDATDFQVFTTAGVRQTAEEWPVATGAKPRGATWDSARSQFVSYDPVAAKLHFYTGIKWTSESGTWWASYTWANPSTSSETTQSARRSVAMKKRSRLRVSLPARPVTDAAVTHSRVYLGRGGTDPGRTAMWLNGGDLTGTALVLSSVAFSGTNPPNASSFATSAPARVESGAGNLVLNGDGSGSAGALTWGTSATSKSTHAGPMDVLGTVLVNIEGSASPLVVGSATNTAEPSVRLRRNGADGLNTYEGYVYMWAGNASALSAQLRKNGAVVNRLDITDGYTSTDDEFRAPKVKSGTGDAQGTNYGEVYRSAAQAIGSGAWTTISWNAWGTARVEDDGALYSSSHWRSNKAGWFSCSSSLTFATAGSGYRSLRIITEGGTVLAREGFDQGTTPFRDAHVSVNCALPGGAYGIRTEAYQNSGASINCSVHSSTEPTISRFGQNA